MHTYFEGICDICQLSGILKVFLRKKRFGENVNGKLLVSLFCTAIGAKANFKAHYLSNWDIRIVTII